MTVQPKAPSGTIEDWLEKVKTGYAERFAAAWRDTGGYHDLEDVLYDAAETLSSEQLDAIMVPAGAKPIDLRRMSDAVRQLAGANAMHTGPS